MMSKLRFLFGKLSLLDYAIALLVILAAVYSLFQFSREKTIVYVDIASLTSDWENPFPPLYLEVDGIKPHAASYDSFGNKTAEVLEVETVHWTGARKAVLLSVQLSVIYDGRTKQYLYNNAPLLIGQKLTIQFENTAAVGLITNLYSKPEDRFLYMQKRHATVTAKYINIDPWHAQAMKQFEVKNAKGEIIARTVNASVLPAEKSVTTDRGDVLKRTDPIKKDVVLTLDLPSVLCSEGSCFYSMIIPLKIGGALPLFSEKTFLPEGSIVDFTIDP